MTTSALAIYAGGVVTGAGAMLVLGLVFMMRDIPTPRLRVKP